MITVEPKSKTQIRQLYREICSNISTKYREQAANAAAQLLVQQAFFADAKRIACFLSTKHEFDASPIIEAIWQAKKHCYVPVLTEENEKSLYFSRYQYGDALHLNRYHILEPIEIRKLAPENLEVVLLPLVAFDCYGHRVGSGGGYYDRTFAFLHANPSKKPLMIGLAYTAQQIDNIPADPWDIKLDGILTEKEFIACD